MKKICYTRADDNGVSFVIPVAQNIVALSFPEVADMTEDQYLSWIVLRDVPAGALNVKKIDDSKIPTDRVFRDAWEWQTDKVVEKIEKVKTLVKDRHEKKGTLTPSLLAQINAAASVAELKELNPKKEK